MKPIEFIFDFGSPNAYLCHRVIPAIARRHDVAIRYIPCLLGGIFKATGNRAPREAFGEIRNKLAYERLETMRFIERHCIRQFKPNPDFPINTLSLMRGAVFAQTIGQLMPYVDAMMHHMWEVPKKMDDAAVFTTALIASGFDAELFQTGIATQTIKDQLLVNTSHAVERGAFGVPTFFVGDQMWFGKERLNELETFLINN